MPPIAYFNVVRGKDPLLKYETRYHMVVQADGSGIKPTARYYGVWNAPELLDTFLSGIC